MAQGTRAQVDRWQVDRCRGGQVHRCRGKQVDRWQGERWTGDWWTGGIVAGGTGTGGSGRSMAASMAVRAREKLGAELKNHGEVLFVFDNPMDSEPII